MADEIKASPEYPSKHTGVALVVGSAPDAYRELALAKERLPVTPYLIAVNFMAGRIECQAMVTCEREAIEKIKFHCPRPILHVYPSDQRKVANAAPPGVDHLWHGPSVCSGTASLAAVMVAKAIGFEEIILCGVPLEKIGYVQGYPSHGCSEWNNREGAKSMNGSRTQRRETWNRCFKAGMLEGVTSFSGFTRELLGEPRFQKEIV